MRRRLLRTGMSWAKQPKRESRISAPQSSSRRTHFPVRRDCGAAARSSSTPCWRPLRCPT